MKEFLKDGRPSQTQLQELHIVENGYNSKPSSKPINADLQTPQFTST